MVKKCMIIMAALLLTVCLLSGGCSKPDESKIKAWKDLIKIPVNNDKTASQEKKVVAPNNEVAQSTEHINVKLYFPNEKSDNLAVEERSIAKVEGIARKTMEELLKGPSQPGFTSVVPAGTKLLDINIKPDGMCIVNLSSEATGVKNEQQEKLMLYAIADTLGQFPTVKELSFMINGESVSRIGGFIDLGQPIQPDYSISKQKI